MRPTSPLYVALLLISMPGTVAERLGSDQKTVLIQYSVQDKTVCCPTVHFSQQHVTPPQNLTVN